MKRLLCFTLLFFGVFAALKAQDPAYFMLGEVALAGHEIYDIEQDSTSNYWFATSEGLIKYDGHEFRSLRHAQMKGKSVFDLSFDHKGTLFCKNLSGQFFAVYDDSCHLHFELPDSLNTALPWYAFDNENRMVVFGRKIFREEKQGQFKLFCETEGMGFANPHVGVDSTIWINAYNLGVFLKIKSGRYEMDTVVQDLSENTLEVFNIGDKEYIFEAVNSVLFKKQGKDLIPVMELALPGSQERSVGVIITKNYMILRHWSGGIELFDHKLKPLFDRQVHFPNSFISGMLEDNEGNLILGTFGEGLRVLPSVYIQNIRPLPDQQNMVTMTSSDEQVFVGTNQGKVFEISAEQPPLFLRTLADRSVEQLTYLSADSTLICSGAGHNKIDLTTKRFSPVRFHPIKDVEYASNGKYVMGFNIGVALYDPAVQDPVSCFEWLHPYGGRTNSVAYDSLNKQYYAGSARGLKIGNQYEHSMFMLNEERVLCTVLKYVAGKVYAGTDQWGILVFEQGKLMERWTVESQGLLSNSILDLDIVQNELYVSTRLGVQRLTPEGDVVGVLTEADGLQTRSMKNVEIAGGRLFLLYHQGLQTVDLDEMHQDVPVQGLSLGRILVNDTLSVTPENEKLAHNQNKLTFELLCPTLKYRNQLTYAYRLSPIDRTWQENAFEANEISYKTLPPGRYTFEARALYLGKAGNTVSYSFRILKPFWNRWWFYVLVAVLITTLVFAVVIEQLKRQRKKLEIKNELNTSKLVAIQSQMNPHFIFNAINSIQDLILKGDIDNSYSYVVEFSKLVRKTLEFSNQEFIDIEDEVELLEIYLDLEKLRFKEDFQYHLSYDGVEGIQVPPMLVQPTIENAIKHGLLHKEGVKHLNIVFQLEDEALECVVSDDGIGMSRSKEIKERQRKNHKSFSVNATKVRFEIMQDHYQQDLGIRHEVLDPDAEYVGTKVTIKMPFRRTF